MILVVGATSRVGTRLIPKLIAQGERVRAMTRTPSKPEAVEQKKLGAEVVQGDLIDPASLKRACQGVEKVLDAAHGFSGVGVYNPRSVDGAGNRSLIDAAKAAGVQHFVFISILGVSPKSPLEFFRIKYDTEEYLRLSGLSYTILRSAAFMEFWAVLVGEPVLKTGKTTIFGGGKNPNNYVSAEDVARFALIALTDPRARDQSIDVGGPENLTFDQVAQIFAQASGRTVKISHIPLPMMRVMRVLTRPFNPMLSHQITGGILMDTEDQTCDMRPTLEKYPGKLVRLEDLARQMAGNAPA